MSPRVRKFALTAHVIFSVGWIGAIIAYLALAVTALASRDTQTIRSAYLAMQVLAWSAVVPLSFASLLSGMIQSLGTTWGLVRHYWVLFKLVLNLLATAVLLLYTQVDLKPFIDIASRPNWSAADLTTLSEPTHVVHSVAALLLLLGATALAVYKPRGLTRRGRRRQNRPSEQARPVGV